MPHGRRHGFAIMVKKKDPGHKQSVKMRTLLVMRRSLLLASEPGKWILSTVYSQSKNKVVIEKKYIRSGLILSKGSLLNNNQNFGGHLGLLSKLQSGHVRRSTCSNPRSNKQTQVLYMSFDKFHLAVESRDLSQADKSII